MHRHTPRLLSAFCMFTFLSTLFLAGYAFADPGVVVSPGDFLSETLKQLQGFGGLGFSAKLAVGLTIIVSSMKVSVLNGLWDKLGGAKVYVAPALSLIAGALLLKPFSFAGLAAYGLSGAGAVFLHEILDSIKNVPGIGKLYVSIINVIQSALHGPPPQVAPADEK